MLSPVSETVKNLVNPLLKNIKSYIVENLCRSNKNIFNYLYKLKKEKKIKNVWTVNGIVYFQKLDTVDDRGIKVEHFDNIEFYLNL